MDITVYLLLIAEAALALALLHLSGVLKKPWHVLLSAGLLAITFILRGICLDYETLDYQNFLAVWVDFFRQNGGLAALKESVGNYNVPYLTFLALFSQSAVKDLYLIKLLSIFFDVILAWGVMRIAGHFVKSAERQLLAFFLVLFWPTVILNGALWGQCDSIYVAFAVLSIAMALEDRPWLCVTAMGACFAFKLQAVFFIPSLLLFLLRSKIQWKHLLAFPVINVILVLPAVIAGRGMWDALTVGLQETGSIGDGLNYNSPSVFAFFRNVANPTEAGQFGILAAALVIAMVAVVFFWKRKTASDLALLTGTVLLAVAIPFFLPHMHDRYFYGADMFSLALGCAALPLMPLAMLCEFASGLGYHAYKASRFGKHPACIGPAADAAVPGVEAPAADAGPDAKSPDTTSSDAATVAADLGMPFHAFDLRDVAQGGQIGDEIHGSQVHSRPTEYPPWYHRFLLQKSFLRRCFRTPRRRAV